MGLFSPASPLQYAEYEQLLVTADKNRKQDTRILAKNEHGIAAELQGKDEDLLVLAVDWSSVSGGMLVVTDRRSIAFRKGRIDRQLAHGEIHDTWIGTKPNGGILVEIRSKTAILDYSPNDPQRYRHIIQSSVGTPRAGQMICAAVDARL
jgi:hypothetical protein